jgi:hypothetical protein
MSPKDRAETTVSYTPEQAVAEPVGQINLIRAIVDESDDLIQADKEELRELMLRQEFLTNRIAAYEELRDVSKKHFSKLTVTVTPKTQTI